MGKSLLGYLIVSIVSAGVGFGASQVRTKGESPSECGEQVIRALRERDEEIQRKAKEEGAKAMKGWGEYPEKDRVRVPVNPF